jgi:hypothetical protein
LQFGFTEVHVKQGVKLLTGSLVLVTMAASCSSDGTFDDDSLNFGPSAAGGSSSGEPLDPGEQVPLPEPEKEADASFRVPVVSGRWVWTANPTSGRVALIDATSFTVKTALAGAAPTYLAALPAPKGSSRALVLNARSNDATLLATTADGEIEARATLPVHAGANAWATTPDGRFAIAWTDASAEANPDPSQGFQDITVLDLEGETPSSKRLSVGYRPARVFMDDDSRYAYVVTDAGIDVVDLKSERGPIVEREVEVSANPANDTARRDVNVTPDGAFAFVSRDGKDYITVVNVEQGRFKDIALPGVVTDLDLSADASLAIAIVREPTLAADTPAAGAGAGGVAGQANEVGAGEGGAGAAAGGGGSDAGGAAGQHGGEGGGDGVSEGGAGPGQQAPTKSMVVLLPVATAFDAPGTFERVRLNELFGSVELGQQGETALLYSNGVPRTHLTLLQLGEAAGSSHRTLDLKIPIFSAISTPDGAHAIALLEPPAGSKLPGAFAVVPVRRNLPAKIQGTKAITVAMDAGAQTPAMVAISDERALVTVSDGVGTHLAYLARMPELTVDAIELASKPLPRASGIVSEANQAFIAQQHPEGRITFIDLDTNAVHTLTGFELSSQVSQ